MEEEEEQTGKKYCYLLRELRKWDEGMNEDPGTECGLKEKESTKGSGVESRMETGELRRGFENKDGNHKRKQSLQK